MRKTSIYIFLTTFLFFSFNNLNAQIEVTFTGACAGSMVTLNQTGMSNGKPEYSCNACIGPFDALISWSGTQWEFSDNFMGIHATNATDTPTPPCSANFPWTDGPSLCSSYLVAGADCSNSLAPAPAAAAVPTIGEWGLIILALLILSIGTLYSVQPNLQTANRNQSISVKPDFRNWEIPFQKSLFQKMWLGTIVCLTIVFASSIFFFGYELTNADVPMGILASGIFAFLGQLLISSKR